MFIVVEIRKNDGFEVLVRATIFKLLLIIYIYNLTVILETLLDRQKKVTKIERNLIIEHEQ